MILHVYFPYMVSHIKHTANTLTLSTCQYLKPISLSQPSDQECAPRFEPHLAQQSAYRPRGRAHCSICLYKLDLCTKGCVLRHLVLVPWFVVLQEWPQRGGERRRWGGVSSSRLLSGDWCRTATTDLPNTCLTWHEGPRTCTGSCK